MRVTILATPQSEFRVRTKNIGDVYTHKTNHHIPSVIDFNKAFKLTHDSLRTLLENYYEIESIKDVYSSSCRESLVSHAATYLDKMSLHYMRFPWVFIQFENWRKLTNLERRYIAYLYKQFAPYLNDFKYTINDTKQTFQMEHAYFNVPLVSFLMYFVKYPYRFGTLPPNNKMQLEYLYHIVENLVKAGNKSSIFIAFTLWYFLTNKSLDIFYLNDNIHGNSSSGIVTAIEQQFKKGRYFDHYKTFCETYRISITRYLSDRASYALYIEEKYSYNQFKLDRMYRKV
jgi:hypothetical protein